ncbi:unnamed protein product [Chironomus riparius]|uniref:J domain-containing protein n=1 Tax=Chironomus riparius TaxID=315576 RepID=A0A9N9RP59_9DIPT|nr:unnamed protein product [Chironomus riparius]
MEYFSDLGIRKGATLSEIKNAFKKLALKFHPDKNSAKSAEEIFKRIYVAYIFLLSSASSNYDPKKEYSNQYQQPSNPKQEQSKSKQNQDQSNSKPQPSKTNQHPKRNFHIRIDFRYLIIIIAILVPTIIFRNEIIEIASILFRVIVVLYNIIKKIVFIAERVIPAVTITLFDIFIEFIKTIIKIIPTLFTIIKAILYIFVKIISTIIDITSIIIKSLRT